MQSVLSVCQARSACNPESKNESENIKFQEMRHVLATYELFTCTCALYVDTKNTCVVRLLIIPRPGELVWISLDGRQAVPTLPETVACACS
ncbi:hypothetical protein BaRGS_00009822 [Batillaria attramentaria]|uniref:Uncharacterized protein n=1 Tax=Batillaria attramentaria TaxID=370345 RepID=A0ABD0LHX5_9CAEN